MFMYYMHACPSRRSEGGIGSSGTGLVVVPGIEQVLLTIEPSLYLMISLDRYTCLSNTLLFS